MNAEASRSLYRRRRPLEIPALAGCRGSEDARRFYERCAFQPLPEGQTTLMITLKDAGQALAGRRDINANDTSQSRTGWPACVWAWAGRSEEHTSELQSLIRNSYAVFCLKKKQNKRK